MGGHGGKLTEEGKFAAVAALNSFVAGGEFWHRRGHNVEEGCRVLRVFGLDEREKW
jgi:hypothetical protein